MALHSAGIGGAGTYLGSGRDILMEGFTWTSVSTANYFTYLTGEIPQIQASGATLMRASSGTYYFRISTENSGGNAVVGGFVLLRWAGNLAGDNCMNLRLRLFWEETPGTA